MDLTLCPKILNSIFFPPHKIFQLILNHVEKKKSRKQFPHLQPFSRSNSKLPPALAETHRRTKCATRYAFRSLHLLVFPLTTQKQMHYHRKHPPLSFSPRQKPLRLPSSSLFTGSLLMRASQRCGAVHGCFPPFVPAAPLMRLLIIYIPLFPFFFFKAGSPR